MGHARALLGLESEKDIEALRREIQKNDMNVRQTEKRVRQLKTARKAPEKKKDIFIKDLETELERKLGTKVEIIQKQRGGKVVITYYSNDDLERIHGMIEKKNQLKDRLH